MTHKCVMHIAKTSNSKATNGVDNEYKWDSTLTNFENKQWDCLETLLHRVKIRYVGLSAKDKETLQRLFFNKAINGVDND